MQQMMIYWQSIIPQHVSGLLTPIIRRADSVHCELCRGCCLSGTHLAIRLSRTTTTIATTGNHRQWHAVCSPCDRRKDPRNMLRNKWLPVNHHLLNLVGLAFICLPKTHGQSSIKFSIFWSHLSPSLKCCVSFGFTDLNLRDCRYFLPPSQAWPTAPPLTWPA